MIARASLCARSKSSWFHRGAEHLRLRVETTARLRSAGPLAGFCLGFTLEAFAQANRRVEIQRHDLIVQLVKSVVQWVEARMRAWP